VLLKQCHSLPLCPDISVFQFHLLVLWINGRSQHCFQWQPVFFIEDLEVGTISGTSYKPTAGSVTLMTHSWSRFERAKDFLDYLDSIQHLVNHGDWERQMPTSHSWTSFTEDHMAPWFMQCTEIWLTLITECKVQWTSICAVYLGTQDWSYLWQGEFLHWTECILEYLMKTVTVPKKFIVLWTCLSSISHHLEITSHHQSSCTSSKTPSSSVVCYPSLVSRQEGFHQGKLPESCFVKDDVGLKALDICSIPCECWKMCRVAGKSPYSKLTLCVIVKVKLSLCLIS
jgi:hypothetical protein